MSTTITLTGTGVPHPSPGRAGPGVLVRHGAVALQFDAGRATVLRLAEAGVEPHELSALLLTHVHSDHVVDLADVAMTRWVQGTLHPAGPLPIVCPAGGAERFVQTMFDPFADDIALRIAHVQDAPPAFDLRTFAPRDEPTEVWRSDDGAVVIDAVAVHHEPVVDAVGYRITTTDGIIAISGDTRVCAEVEALASGADVLVHEACRASALHSYVEGTALETIFSYHADTVALGGLAERAGVPHLVLTHLIPAPADEAGEQAFVDDVRSGGYSGRVTVGRDLMRVVLDG